VNTRKLMIIIVTANKNNPINNPGLNTKYSLPSAEKESINSTLGSYKPTNYSLFFISPANNPVPSTDPAIATASNTIPLVFLFCFGSFFASIYLFDRYLLRISILMFVNNSFICFFPPPFLIVVFRICYLDLRIKQKLFRYLLSSLGCLLANNFLICFF